MLGTFDQISPEVESGEKREEKTKILTRTALKGMSRVWREMVDVGDDVPAVLSIRRTNVEAFLCRLPRMYCTA